VQPYVQAFDLGMHQYVGIHVNNLEEYKYDSNLASKLVLPEKTKQLVNVLMESSAAIMEDIIAGKTGGTVVIATGEPGTGKTLTAECYSEQIERPLYSIQCSQLGTDEEQLEKKLLLTLNRASRWGAILLIDEADVYVRERGNDIQQNAIVGIFLRLLERYRGILFLTSNRATTIDDAIISRAVAHVRYTLPSRQELTQIWKVLADNYKVSLTDGQIQQLIEEFPAISGRNVKNILKLAVIMTHKTKKGVTVDDLLYVTRFIDLAKASDDEMKREEPVQPVAQRRKRGD
jgi:AAA+ superfamily predicted ATPase